MHAQADNEFREADGESNRYGYVAYFAVLVIWEIIPTYMVVVFFRVKIPSRSSVSWHHCLSLIDMMIKLAVGY